MMLTFQTASGDALTDEEAEQTPYQFVVVIDGNKVLSGLQGKQTGTWAFWGADKDRLGRPTPSFTVTKIGANAYISNLGGSSAQDSLSVAVLGALMRNEW